MKLQRIKVEWTLISMSDFEKALELTSTEHDRLAWHMEHHVNFDDDLAAFITVEKMLTILLSYDFEPLRVEVIRHALADVTYIDLNA